MLKVSELFRTKREELGLTMRAVSTETGVNRQTISNLERGTGLPDAIGLLKLIEFYKLDNTEILIATGAVEAAAGSQ